MFDMLTYFEGVSKRMLNEFKEITIAVNYPLRRGESREDVLRDFLKKYLPKKYSVGKGIVFNSIGESSRELDIVIYDNLECPLLYNENNVQFFPIEGIYAVVEVKSNLGREELKDAVGKVESIKKLSAFPDKIAGLIFGYSCRQSLVKTFQVFLELLEHTDPKRRTDFVCILDVGCITFFEKGTNIFAMSSFPPAEPGYFGLNPLLSFYLHLWLYLSVREVQKPPLTHYAFASVRKVSNGRIQNGEI